MIQNISDKAIRFLYARKVMVALASAFAATAVMAFTTRPEVFAIGDAIPMLSADGYHHLYVAEQLQSGVFSTPFLSWLTRWCSDLFSCSAASVAPYVSVIIYFFSIVGLFWSFGLVLPLGAASVGAIVSGLYPYYYFRAVPNWFDTDSLIIFCLSILCGSVISLGRLKAHRRWYIMLLLAAAGLLFWTWQTAAIVAGIFVFVAALPFFSLRQISITLFIAFIVCMLGVVGLPDLLEWGVAHATLLFTGEVERYAGIAELQPATMLDLFKALPFGIIFGGIVGIGLVFGMTSGKKEFYAFFFSWFSLGVLCLVSTRFAIFIAPLVGLSIASFYTALIKCVPLRSSFLDIILMCFLVVPFGFSVCAPPKTSTFFSQEQRKLVSSLADYNERNSDSVLFSWWDTGYFVQYVTKIPVFADGGRQNKIRTRILQQILSVQDVRTSRHLIRFLAVHGFDAFFRVPTPYSKLAMENSEVAFEERLAWVSQLLSSKNRAKRLMREKGVSFRYWIPVLFPSTEKSIFIYLDNGLFDRTWWFLPSEKLMSFPAPTFSLPSGTVAAQQKTITLNGKTLPIVMKISRSNSLATVNTVSSGNGVVVVETGEEQRLLPSAMVQSLAARLLLFGKADGFVPVTYRTGVGGIWQIQ